MRRLGNLVAVIGTLLAAHLALGTLTPVPATAQNTKAPSEVRVVNSTAQAVPVAVQGSLEVSIGNDSGNPVPVTIADVPAPAAEPQPVAIVTEPLFEAGTNITQFGPIYTVPAGKRLLIDYVNAAANSLAGEIYRLEVQTYLDGTQQFGEYALLNSANRGYLTEQMQLFADGGTDVSLYMTRSGTPGLVRARVTLTGHLVDAQSATP